MVAWRRTTRRHTQIWCARPGRGPVSVSACRRARACAGVLFSAVLPELRTLNGSIELWPDMIDSPPQSLFFPQSVPSQTRTRRVVPGGWTEIQLADRSRRARARNRAPRDSSRSATRRTAGASWGTWSTTTTRTARAKSPARAGRLRSPRDEVVSMDVGSTLISGFESP